jgi:hypothetical protein
MPPPAIDINALRKNYDVQGGGPYEVSSIASKSCDVLNNTSSSRNPSLDSRSDRRGGFRRSPFGTSRKWRYVRAESAICCITDISRRAEINEYPP